MAGFGDWLIPEVSLPTQLQMECDRRAAARLGRDELAGKIDELIQAWYMQHSLINRMLGEIRQLQVQVVLAGDPKPARHEPEPQHYRWARELMGQP